MNREELEKILKGCFKKPIKKDLQMLLRLCNDLFSYYFVNVFEKECGIIK